MKTYRFWLVLAAIFTVLGVVQLPWAPSRFGGLFFLVLAVGCFAEWLLLRNREKSKVCRVIAIVGKVLFSLFLVSFIGIQGIILTGMREDPDAENADYLLVLGARVYEDGRPSAALAARLDTALDFLAAHPDAKAVLCGGQGSNEPMPEADAMYEYMLQKGATADRLFRESKSTNTIQNIQNAYKIVDEDSKDSFDPVKYGLSPDETDVYSQYYIVAVVTSDYHLARARVLMGRTTGWTRLGIPAPTPYPAQRLAVHCREYCSILGLMLSGRWF